MVCATLDALAALGATGSSNSTSPDGRGLVVRTWAFNDGPGWMSLQPAPGEGGGTAAGGNGARTQHPTTLASRYTAAQDLHCPAPTGSRYQLADEQPGRAM